MNCRLTTSCAIAAVTVLMGWAILAQSHRIRNLQAHQRAFLSALSGTDKDSRPANESVEGAQPQVKTPAGPEVLKLRNEAARLAELRREMEPIATENRRLHSQVARAKTNSTPELSPAYLRKSQARFAGYNSPEATLESFLWSIHSRNTNNFLRALVPESVRQTQQMPTGLEELLNQMQAFVGMSIVKRDQLTDGSTVLKIQVTPELPAADIKFQIVEGEWKMEMPR